MKKYYYYIKTDKTKENLGLVFHFSRLKAANYFAIIKVLPLKEFLKIYSISKPC